MDDGVKELFLLADGYTNLNHGSFGAVPKQVFERQVELMRKQEERPDQYLRTEYFQHLKEGRVAVSNLVNCPVEQLVFVENASTAVNAALRTVCKTKDDNILILDCAYPMVTCTVDTMIEEGLVGEKVVCVVEIPVDSEKAVVDALTAALASKPKGFFKACVFSHIVSLPAITLPIKAMAKACKERGVECVIVDGAHAIGQLPLDMEDIFAAGIDVFTSNCHKWLFSPKGTAILCTRNGLNIIPTVISASYKTCDVHTDRFNYVGTRDYNPFCAVSSAVEFVQSTLGGIDKVMAYNHSLVEWMYDTLPEKLHATPVCPLSMMGSMFTVKLPQNINATVAKQGLLYFLEKHNMAVVINPIGDSYFLRISAQVYLSKEDISRGVDIIIKELEI
eukprot:m.63062 g.63062  ORF g.63062 m.63062 type:complete len:391 (+) comp8054_c1_seq4:344-1516(+)